MRERIKNIFSFFFEHLECKRLPFYSGSLTAGVGKGKESWKRRVILNKGVTFYYHE